LAAGVFSAQVGAQSARAQFREARYQERVAVYRRFLNADRTLQSMLWRKTPALDPIAYAEWTAEFDDAYNGVRLLVLPVVNTRAIG